MSLNVLLVAGTHAPTRAFRKLIPHLEQHGVNIRSHLLDHAEPAPPREVLSQAIERSDIVLLGMSSPESNAESELVAAHLCKMRGRPFGFYADTHGAWTREHFRQFSRDASFLFVVNEDEKRRAKERFPNAAVTVTSNPLWASYFLPADREASRAFVHAAFSERIILAPGTKNAAHNISVWTAVIQAAVAGANRVVVLARHPGDSTSDEVYASLAKFSKALGVRVLITDTQTDDLVPGADVVINGTSVRVHALARRIPVIDYYEPLSRVWLSKDTGSLYSYFHRSGAVYEVYGGSWKSLVDSLGSALQYPRLHEQEQAAVVEQVAESTVLERMRIALEAMVPVSA